MVQAAVAAEVDNLGLALVELTQQIDRPSTRDQDQLHRVAERAEADLLVDLPKFSGQIERGCPSRVSSEEQDLDHLGPTLERVRKGEFALVNDVGSNSKEKNFPTFVNEPIDHARQPSAILAPG
jgi:hypothetical protein